MSDTYFCYYLRSNYFKIQIIYFHHSQTKNLNTVFPTQFPNNRQMHPTYTRPIAPDLWSFSGLYISATTRLSSVMFSKILFSLSIIWLLPNWIKSYDWIATDQSYLTYLTDLFPWWNSITEPKSPDWLLGIEIMLKFYW